jgi:hypothetical protein
MLPDSDIFNVQQTTKTTCMTFSSKNFNVDHFYYTRDFLKNLICDIANLSLILKSELQKKLEKTSVL